MKIFSVKGENDIQAWKAYCDRIATVYPSLKNDFSAYLDQYYSLSGKELLRSRSTILAHNIPQELIPVLKLISKATGLSEDQVLDINLLGDIARPTGCSSIMHKSQDGHVMLAHNLDWPDFNISHRITALTRLESDCTITISQGFAGALPSAMSINGNGVAIAIHDSYTGLPYDCTGRHPLGLGIASLIRKVRSAEEMVKAVSQLKFTYGCMLFVTDPQRGFIVEHAINDILVREIEPGECICRTNHFREIGIDNSYNESLARADSLEKAKVGLMKTSPCSLQTLYDIITAEGVFRPLNENNRNCLSSCSVLTLAYDATTGNIIASGIEEPDTGHPGAPYQFNIKDFPVDNF